MYQERDDDEDFFSVFGRIILQFRLEKGLNQEQAAKLCGLSLKKWASLENSNDFPTKNTMIKICKHFDVPQKDFLQRLATIIDDVIAEHKKSENKNFPANWKNFF